MSPCYHGMLLYNTKICIMQHCTISPTIKRIIQLICIVTNLHHLKCRRVNCLQNLHKTNGKQTVKIETQTMLNQCSNDPEKETKREQDYHSTSHWHSGQGYWFRQDNNYRCNQQAQWLWKRFISCWRLWEGWVDCNDVTFDDVNFLSWQVIRRYVLRGVGGHGGGGVAPAGFDLESSGCKWRQWMAFDLASGPYLASGRGPH